MILKVEIADTPSKQARGLMYRQSLEDNCGMAFIFKQSQILRFWGLNTYIPLDIAFVNDKNIITQISHIKPFSDSMVSSDKECKIAVEANYGYFDKNNIRVGDTVKIDKDNYGGEVKFIRHPILTAQRVIDWDDVDYDEDDIPTYNPSDISEFSTDDLDDEVTEEPTELIEPTEPTQDDYIDTDWYPPDDLPTIPESPDDMPRFDTPQEAVRWGFNNKETMRIWYKTLRGHDIERIVEPHGTFFAKTTGNNILVTFDRTVNEIRTFIIDNILYYSFTGDDFNKKFNLTGNEINSDKIEKSDNYHKSIGERVLTLKDSEPFMQ